MTDCERKTIFGRPACRFEGRYDELHGAKPDSAQLWLHGVTERALLAMKEKSRTRLTYVRDVCIKCGKTIERSNTHGKA